MAMQEYIQNPESGLLEPTSSGGGVMLPVGFVYTQYPGTLSPTQLNLPGTWQELNNVDLGLMGQPDIANYDPANKITANNGEWINDIGTGFVRVNIFGGSSGNYQYYFKNNKCHTTFMLASSNGLTEQYIDVVLGDRIKLSTTGSVSAGNWTNNPFTMISPNDPRWCGCFFVPPKPLGFKIWQRIA